MPPADTPRTPRPPGPVNVARLPTAGALAKAPAADGPNGHRRYPDDQAAVMTPSGAPSAPCTRSRCCSAA